MNADAKKWSYRRLSADGTEFFRAPPGSGCAVTYDVPSRRRSAILMELPGRCGRARDHAKARALRRAAGRARVAEMRCVESIESVHPEPRFHALAEFDPFGKRQVEVDDAGHAERRHIYQVRSPHADRIFVEVVADHSVGPQVYVPVVPAHARCGYSCKPDTRVDRRIQAEYLHDTFDHRIKSRTPVRIRWKRSWSSSAKRETGPSHCAERSAWVLQPWRTCQP